MFRNYLLVSTFLLLVFTQYSYSQNINDFNGTWIGEVEIIYSTQEPPIKEDKAKVKIVINRNNVDIYTFKTNLNARGKYLTNWKDFMKDKLEIRRHKSNVIITGLDSGKDENGNHWVDSITVELARIDRKYAWVNFSKQINNDDKSQQNVFGIGKFEVINNTNR